MANSQAARMARARLFLTASALFATVFGARLWLIGTFGSELPFWDQWDSEFEAVLKPYLQGHVTLEPFLRAHCEHRIFFTKVIAFVSVLVNGLWDAKLEIVINAAFASLMLVGLLLANEYRLRLTNTTLLAVVLAALFGLPIGWFNTLGGFQSQFYFVTGFSILGLTLVTDKAGSWTWGVGLLALGAALFSMGSGVIASVIACGMLLLRFIESRKEFRANGSWLTLLLCIGLVVIGWSIHEVVPGHAGLRAQNSHDFGQALANCMSWPSDHAILAPLVWFPFAVHAATTVRAIVRRSPCDADRWLTWMGLWILAQEMAMALMRGANGATPAARYQDILLIGVLINLLCLLRLIGHSRWRVVIAAGWAMYVVLSLVRVTNQTLTVELPSWHQHFVADVSNTRAYLATHDPSFLERPLFDIPYPNSARLKDRLRDSVLRLPQSVRATDIPGATQPPGTRLCERSCAPRAHGVVMPAGAKTKCAAIESDVFPTIDCASMRSSNNPPGDLVLVGRFFLLVRFLCSFGPWLFAIGWLLFAILSLSLRTRAWASLWAAYRSNPNQA